MTADAACQRSPQRSRRIHSVNPLNWAEMASVQSVCGEDPRKSMKSEQFRLQIISAKFCSSATSITGMKLMQQRNGPFMSFKRSRWWNNIVQTFKSKQSLCSPSNEGLINKLLYFCIPEDEGFRLASLLNQFKMRGGGGIS